MNLKKAIEFNQESESSLRNHKFADHADAVALGNEALKRLQDIRGLDASRPVNLLPGETKD